MAEASNGSGSSVDRRKGKRGGTELATAEAAATGTSPPCGACKFLRRKCTNGCIFAPHFGSDQGAAKFAAVHKVFGASNVSKLLMHIPTSRRHDAVVTISYEAQARLSDPVYGCVSTILALQQQVASLQAELALVQSQLINSRLAVANVFESSQQHQSGQIGIIHHQQPAYSNNSSASTNLNNPALNTGDMSSCCFAISTNNYDHNHNSLVAIPPAATDQRPAPPPSYHLFEPLRLSTHVDEDDDEEDSRARNVTFVNHIMR